MFIPKASKATPWRAPSAFTESHCMKCEAGWVRRNKGGNYLIVCLLDRDPVLPETIHCDRFDPREAKD